METVSPVVSNVGNQASYSSVLQQFFESATKIITDSPNVVITLLLSWLSGYLWQYLILEYKTNKNKTNNNSNRYERVERLAYGITWYALLFLPIHLIKYGFSVFSRILPMV